MIRDIPRKPVLAAAIKPAIIGVPADGSRVGSVGMTYTRI